MHDAETLKRIMSQYHGSDTFTRHGLNRKMIYTDGVEYFAENAGHGAYWFLDIIATEGMDYHFINPFMVIKLRVNEGESAMITMDNGNDEIFFTRAIEFTDCPVGEWTFYLENNTLLLPGER